MSELSPKIKKFTAGSMLSLLALTSCSSTESAVPVSTKTAVKCVPVNLILTAQMQGEIVRTKQWPEKLRTLPHTGKILGIQYFSAEYIDVNGNSPKLADAHVIVDTFLTAMDSVTTPPTKVEVIQDLGLTEGRIHLVEFDQNCANEIAGIPDITAPKSATI